MWAGLDLKEFPNLSRWTEKLDGRPAFAKGIAIPQLTDHINKKLVKKAEEDPDFIERESEKARKWIVQSK